MPRKDREPTEPTEADESLVELDREYEYGGVTYGPGQVRIESRPARRAILRAMENEKLATSSEATA